MPTDIEAAIDEVQRERDFYRALAQLADHDRLDALLEHALAALVARVRAREVMIEAIEDAPGAAPHVVAHGCEGDRVSAISSYVSRGIIAEAIASGKTVVTANATLDPRFGEFKSVQRHQLEAVLCVPLGDAAHLGVIYLQGRATGADPHFGDETQREVERLARALSGPLQRLLGRPEPAVAAPAPAPRRPRDPGDPFAAVCGRSQVMEEVVERLRHAAQLDVIVLLTGSSGVGKTLLASAIHLASRRRSGPFIEINCAAIPEALLESELFGAEPGAHSAVTRGAIKGKVEAAEGGTLFLDEVAELAPGAQAKLLQLLQSRTYYRLGGASPRRANVRLVAATNVNLQAAIAERKFRDDLYYRLNVLEVRVPPLAERPEDVAPLAVELLQQVVARHQLSRKTLSPNALRAIQAAPWPGNVRQLANKIESATIRAELRGATSVEDHDVFPDGAQGTGDAAQTLQGATRRFQRSHLLGVLTSTDWNIPEACRILDVSRSHLYNLIRIFELKRD